MTEDIAGRPRGLRAAPPWVLPALILTTVLGIVLATYWPALAARAQYMDDKFYLGSALIQHPSWTSVKTIFGEVLEPSMVNGYYQPLALVSLMLDFLDPAAAQSLLPFHRTTLILHLLNVALVALFLRALFRNWLVAGLLALIYGVHPMNADAVLWIAERKTVLSTFFALSSLLCYVAHARHGGPAGRGNWQWYTAALILYAGALLAKPTALPVVALLFVLDYWPLARLDRKVLLEKLPFVALAIVSGAIALISQVRSGQGGALEYTKLQYLPLTVVYGVGFYLLKIVRPVGLVSDYVYPHPFGLTNPEVLGCVLVALGGAAAIALSLRRTRAWLAGGLLFILAVVPTLGLIRFTLSITSNRSMYLAMVGLLVPLQWELTRLWQGVAASAKAAVVRTTVIGAGIAVALAGAGTTRRYEAHWQDTMTLLRYYLSVQPNDYRLHTRMGNEWIQRNDHRAAITEFREAIRLNPTWTENHLNVGRALLTIGDYAEAASAFATALSQTPKDWRAHMLMGMTRGRQDDLTGALEEFQTAAGLAPKAAAPHFHIAGVLGRQGKLAEAIAEYRETLRLEPRYTDAQRMLDLLGAPRTPGNPP